MTTTSSTARSVEEIVARATELRDSPQYVDMFGAQYGNLVLALPFEAAKPFLKDDATPADWRQEDPHDEAVQYMEFAINKATDHRGLSANRSIDHYRAWMWLLGRDEEIDWDTYPLYGAPILKQLCVALGIPVDETDEVFARMANGEPCRDDCEEGCI